MKLLIGLLMILLTTQIALSKDFGKQGATFAVKEEGFLAMIMRKLKNLNIEEHQQKMQNIVRERAETPAPVIGIRRTAKQEVHSFDPTYVLDEDIYLPNGQLLYRAGTRVNPLDHLDWNGKLIFIDATDSTQVAWLSANYLQSITGRGEEDNRENNKIILVAGKPIELERQLKTSIYFDQSGELTSKFNISQVPAIVEQDGKYLKVTEVYIGEAR